VSGVLNLVTGPSGGGKSVFCKKQTDWEHCIYNLDEATRLFGDVNDPENRKQGWRALVGAVRHRMASNAPVICVDSVLGERDFDDLAAAAREYGYDIRLWVISPETPGACEERIRQRMAEGGHGRPEMAAELFQSALAAASQFALECNHTLLMDTTQDDEFTPIAHLKNYVGLQYAPTIPNWVQEYFPIEYAPAPQTAACAIAPKLK